MTTALILGSTGAVGSLILQHPPHLPILDLHNNDYPAVPPAQDHQNLHPILDGGPNLSALTPVPTVVFNAVGTTCATAGSMAVLQHAIDHNLCYSLARDSKADGVKRLISVFF
ncbi:hypothetical protein E4T47_01753 [Aureobasidium subglaciale]|nr:hypothetical protein E4T47_01753 [Aureobasidium subglaciale]